MRVPASADVLIVGSGPIGAAAARAIRRRRPDAHIVMLERGPVIAKPIGTNVRNLPAGERSEPQRQSEGDQVGALSAFRRDHGEPLIQARPGTRLVAFTAADGPDQTDMPAAAYSTNTGGMGAHWTCAVPRPGGSEVVPFIDAAALDLAFAEAEEYLKRTQQGFVPSRESEFVLAAVGGSFDAGRDHQRRVQPMPLACVPHAAGLPHWVGADDVLEPLQDDYLFELHAQVAATELVSDGDRIGGVRYTDLISGESGEIAVDAVFVAADALRTPQLLWASGVRPWALGRFLNDQPQVVSAVALDFPAPRQGEKQSETQDGRDALTGVLWIPFDDATGFPFHGQIMQMDASPIAIGDESTPDNRTRVGVGLFATKELRPEDRVWFDETSVDEVGLPSIHIDYELTDRDRERQQFAIDTVGRIASLLGDYAPGGQPRLLPAGSSLHYQGTVRAGTNPNDSVCDPHARVWGVRNLFVGGNGVIPTETACNPTLTAAAFAVRSAEAIATQLQEAAHRALEENA